MTPRLLPQFIGHGLQGLRRLAALAFNPRWTALAIGAPRLEERSDGGIKNAIRQSLPALDADALPSGRGNQPVVRRHGIQIFGDYAGIEESSFVVQHQYRNLAQGVQRGYLIFRSPG